MSILVTGVAGFIGFHVADRLLQRGEHVVGIDNLNDYYDPMLKRARLSQLKEKANFTFEKIDLTDRQNLGALASNHSGITQIIHLAAQAGVRYSLENPYVYISSNVMGHVVLLEFARNLSRLKNLVYASSSSVYGSNEKLPFSEGDPVETPQSLYAATKRADELISYTYSHLYGIPLVGLRFFTVYGPFGRPDMAPMLFARAIFAGEPIHVFNFGDLWRDFTYIDDIVAGILAAMESPHSNKPPHRIYNLGNCKSEKLTDFIAALEAAIGKKAELILTPMQAGDVRTTYADIDKARNEIGFEPSTTMRVGVTKFIDWYRSFYKI